MSELSEPFDVTLPGVDEMLPPGSAHLIRGHCCGSDACRRDATGTSTCSVPHGGNRIVSSGNTLIAGPGVGSWDRRLPGIHMHGARVDSTRGDALPSGIRHLDNGAEVYSKVLAKNGIGLLQFSFREDWDIAELYGFSVLDGLTLLSDVAVSETYYDEGESVDKSSGTEESMQNTATLQADSLQATQRGTRPTRASWPAAWWRRTRRST